MLTILQSLAIIGAAFVIMFRGYRSPEQRARATRFLRYRLGLVIGGTVALLIGVTTLVDGQPAGLIAAVLVGAAVAAAVDLVAHRRRFAQH